MKALACRSHSHLRLPDSRSPPRAPPVVAGRRERRCCSSRPSPPWPPSAPPLSSCAVAVVGKALPRSRAWRPQRTPSTPTTSWSRDGGAASCLLRGHPWPANSCAAARRCEVDDLHEEDGGRYSCMNKYAWRWHHARPALVHSAYARAIRCMLQLARQSTRVEFYSRAGARSASHDTDSTGHKEVFELRLDILIAISSVGRRSRLAGLCESHLDVPCADCGAAYARKR